MPTSTFRLSTIGCIAAFFAFATSVHAQRFLLEPVLPSAAVQTNATTPPSGGNTSPAPTATGPFRLAESAIGYMGPTQQAGINTYATLMAAGQTEVDSGTTYDTVGSVGVPGNWQIVFPGVVNVSTGVVYTASDTSNFSPSKVRNAIALYRTVITAFPNDLAAQIAFVNALRELIAPHTFAGNNAYARATKERLLYGSDDTGNGLASAREDDMLTRAATMFDTSILEFSNVFGSADSISAGFSASFPPITTTVQSEIDIIMTQRSTLTNTRREFARAIARAMNHKAESLMRLYSLRYFQQFGTQGDLSAITTAIDADVAGLQSVLLLASNAGSPAGFISADLAPTRNLVAMLAELKAAIQKRDLKFVGQDFDGATEVIRARSYHEKFIPFAFDALLDPTRPTTTAVLLSKAQLFAQKAITADTAAVSDTGRVEENLDNLATRLSQIGAQYQTQLAQLCGRRDDGNGNLVPDIEGATAPPERRTSLELGEIGQAWFQIDRAEQALEAAMQSRRNISASIDLRLETWRKIKGSREDLVNNTILPTGEKLAEIERLQAEEQAKFTEYQARLAKKKRKRSLLGSIVSTVAGAAAAYFTGGASLIVTGASLVAKVGDGAGPPALLPGIITNLAGAATDYSIAGLGIKELRGQADLQRRIGELNAKRIELQTQQQAAQIFQTISEDGYRTEEAIQLLLLEAKTVEISVLSAELAVEQEYSRLESLLNHVSFLLQQQAGVLNLANTNPLNSPDFRLVRNLNVRNAESRFVLAQEFSFLAARAASYVALGSNKVNEISNLSSKILQARTGQRLDALLDLLDAAILDVSIQRGARTLPSEVIVSLRDHIVQRNQVIRDANGNAAPQLYPWEAQTATIGGTEVSGATEPISDAAWLAFLQAHYIDDGVGNARLEIPFRLSLDQWGSAQASRLPSASRFKNPLFSRTEYGQLIWFNQSIPSAFGIRIDILGSALTGVGGAAGYPTVSLAAEGTSYVRNGPPTNFGVNPIPPTDNSLQSYQFGLDQSSPSVASIKAQINGVGSPDTLINQQLHERSPANDRWVMRIYSSSVNDSLLGQLQNIRDIRIKFAISAYSSSGQ